MFNRISSDPSIIIYTYSHTYLKYLFPRLLASSADALREGLRYLDLLRSTTVANWHALIYN